LTWQVSLQIKAGDRGQKRWGTASSKILLFYATVRQAGVAGTVGTAGWAVGKLHCLEPVHNFTDAQPPSQTGLRDHKFVATQLGCEQALPLSLSNQSAYQTEIFTRGRGLPWSI